MAISEQAANRAYYLQVRARERVADARRTARIEASTSQDQEPSIADVAKRPSLVPSSTQIKLEVHHSQPQVEHGLPESEEVRFDEIPLVGAE